jgi:hypothetical protein
MAASTNCTSLTSRHDSQFFEVSKAIFQHSRLRKQPVIITNLWIGWPEGLQPPRQVDALESPGQSPPLPPFQSIVEWHYL